MMCSNKRESIRTAITSMAGILRMWKKAGKINDQDHMLMLAHIKNINECVNLHYNIEKLETYVQKLNKDE